MLKTMLDRYCVYAKIYGERNTGTTFVEQLLRQNFGVLCLKGDTRIFEYFQAVSPRLPEETRGAFRSAITDIDSERTQRSDFGWKHGVPPREEIVSAPHARHTLFIGLAKHPVSWLRGLAKRPYNPIERVPRKFSQFLRYEWPLTQRDNLPGVERINVVELWNVKNTAFQRLRETADKCVVIAYEEIMRDPHAFLTRLGAYLIPKTEKFVWSLPSTKGDAMSFEDYREKCDIREICRHVSVQDLEFVKARIDGDVMAAFGYEWPATDGNRRP
jgi:hypothetical protein